MNTFDKARELHRLHADPALLILVNVRDVISARVVADTPGTAALAAGERAGIPPGTRKLN
ncbi:MAG TPA: hypothetical protein VES93_03545 [Ornithinibacter sp.]|nr:hypothetical protein [Ornithinibacter sp.]